MEGIYNISITVGLSPAFTPAVLEGIAHITLTRDLVDPDRNIVIKDGSFASLPPLDVDQTTTINTVAPLRENSYLYVVSDDIEQTPMGGFINLAFSEVGFSP